MNSRRYVFITGAYRSGTTLLHRLLDGHPQLRTFPVENCIVRDMLFADRLVNPAGRRMPELEHAARSGDVAGVVDALCAHEKTGLPLKSTFSLTASLGRQTVDTHFNEETFRESMAAALDSTIVAGAQLAPVTIFRAYVDAYFEAIGVPGDESLIFVNKCPCSGWCSDQYLSDFPGARIVHILRDPRDAMASQKATGGRHEFGWPRRLEVLARAVNDSFEHATRLAARPDVFVCRYEDLATEPGDTMRSIAEFLGIAADEVLNGPTLLGQPWHSNTSFADTTIAPKVSAAAIGRHRQVFGDVEGRYVDSLVRPALDAGGYETRGSRHPRWFTAARFRLRHQTSSIVEFARSPAASGKRVIAAAWRRLTP